MLIIVPACATMTGTEWDEVKSPAGLEKMLMADRIVIMKKPNAAHPG